jgi:hypothetical protein
MVRRVLALVLVLVAAAAAGGATPVLTSEPAAAEHLVCDWAAEFDTALASLGEDRADWTLRRLDNNYAQTDLDTLTVEFNPEVPCQHVGDIVRHEWMHLQQGRYYGGAEKTYAAYAGNLELVELVADCGSRLLGSGYLPYLQRGWDCDDTWTQRNTTLLVHSGAWTASLPRI